MTGAIDSNLQDVIAAFTAKNAEAATQRKFNEAVPWFRPDLKNWTGDLQTAESLVDIHAVFNTDQAEQALISNFDPTAPGNNAISILSSLQIDYMAQAERAYRARVSNGFVRSLAHLTARQQGHGDSNGVFSGQVIEYFNDLIKQAY